MVNTVRYFMGGTILQRPSLAMLNGVVIGAFGGHVRFSTFILLIRFAN